MQFLTNSLTSTTTLSLNRCSEVRGEWETVGEINVKTVAEDDATLWDLITTQHLKENRERGGRGSKMHNNYSTVKKVKMEGNRGDF